MVQKEVGTPERTGPGKQAAWHNLYQAWAPAVLALLALLYAFRLLRIGITDFAFDDALMFVRYAHNMRHGDGIAWNPGGPPVYGLTSLTWLVVAWLGTFVPFPPITFLVTSSWLFGLLFLLILACSTYLLPSGTKRLSPLVIGPFIALPLLLDAHFVISLTSGMETMLGLLLLTLFLLLVLRTFRIPGRWAPVVLGILGLLTVATRPDALLCVLAFPVCWWLFVERRRNTPALLLFLVTLGVLLLLDLVITYRYFGTPVPLAMYLKWLHAYAGYRVFLNPVAYTCFFFVMAIVPCMVLVLLANRQHVRLLLAFGIPLALEVGYLGTVNQIMGLGGRYYVPYLSFVFLPAILVLHQRLEAKTPALSIISPGRLTAAVIAALLLNLQTVAPVYQIAGGWLARGRPLYHAPVFETSTSIPLPGVGWWSSCLTMAEIANAMPSGASISASEVGALGALAPATKLIDSSGLNDKTIATHGFSAGYILGTKPDIIWLIHPDYTRDYGELASDPELLKNYTVYSQAFNYGVAIRNDSPYRDQATRAFQQAWTRAYPGYDMALYRTKAITWDKQPFVDKSKLIVIQP